MPLSEPNEEPVVKIFVFNARRTNRSDGVNYFAPLTGTSQSVAVTMSIVSVYLDVLV